VTGRLLVWLGIEPLADPWATKLSLGNHWYKNAPLIALFSKLVFFLISDWGKSHVFCLEFPWEFTCLWDSSSSNACHSSSDWDGNDLANRQSHIPYLWQQKFSMKSYNLSIWISNLWDEDCSNSLIQSCAVHVNCGADRKDEAVIINLNWQNIGEEWFFNCYIGS